MNSGIVYADYAAATPIDRAVLRAMEPMWREVFANPSSVHSSGERAFLFLQKARSDVANFLSCREEEVVFTSGGTESNNLAIIGAARANRSRGRHIVTSSIEHPSVLNACRFLEKEGWEVTYVDPTPNGLIKPESIKKALQSSTTIVSVHLANSEIGVVQDIASISRIVNGNAILHSDACQATPFLPLNVNQLGVDLLTMNGSKAYGPKGVGALYVRQGIEIFPISYGGGQEGGLRSGTENMPGIVGFATALMIINKSRSHDVGSIGALRDNLEEKLSQLEGVRINVKHSPRLPNHLSITLAGAGSENLVESMSRQGVEVSAGSACGARELVPSHVLSAIGLSPEQIHRSIRITLGRPTTASDIEKIFFAVKAVLG